jgi:hypothetical protein
VRELPAATRFELVLLTSSDKVLWTSEETILTAGASGQWDTDRIYRSCPTVDQTGKIVLFDNKIQLFYTGETGSGPTCKIGIAFTGQHGLACAVNEIYDPTANTWTEGAAAPIEIAGQGLMGVSYGNVIHLFYKKYHYVYDPSANTYTRKADVPTPRTWGTCAVVNNKIYVIGGYSYDTNGNPISPSNVNQVYDPATDTWATKSPLPESIYGVTRENPVIGGKIYVTHGFNDTVFKASNYVYDPSANSWSVGSAASHPRDGTACGVIADKLYVVGGRADTAGPYGLNYNEEYGAISPWVFSDASMVYVDASAARDDSYGLLINDNSDSISTYAEHLETLSSMVVDFDWDMTDALGTGTNQPQGMILLASPSSVGSGTLYYYNHAGTPWFEWYYNGGFTVLESGSWNTWYHISIVWAGANSQVIINDVAHPVTASAIASDRVRLQTSTPELSRAFYDNVRVRKYTSPEPSVSIGDEEYPVEYTLTVNTVGNGSVAKVPDHASYHLGNVVQLTATSNAGWIFSSWSGDLSGSTNPASLTVTKNMTVTATFIQTAHLFSDGFESGDFTAWTGTITSGGGTVTASQDFAHHGSWSAKSVTGTAGSTGRVYKTVAHGTEMYLRDYFRISTLPGSSGVTAMLLFYRRGSNNMQLGGIRHDGASAKWSLGIWSSGLGDFTWVYGTHTPVVDHWYCLEMYQKLGSGTGEAKLWVDGTLEISQTGLTTRYTDYIDAPAVGVNTWDSSLATTVYSDCAVVDSSYIGPETHYLTVSSVGTGSVVKVPDQATYASGTVVTLTAVPSAGWNFSAWSGDLSGSVNPTTILIDGNKAVTAHFIQVWYSLTVDVSPVEGGSVVTVPDQASYHYGDVVQLTATPQVGWSFSCWGGDLSGSTNPASLTVTGDMAVMATFNQITWTITVTQSAHGTISPSTASYTQGSSPSETVTPDIGYRIASITVDGSSVPVTSPSGQTVSFNNIHADHSITASFVDNVAPQTTAVVTGTSGTNGWYTSSTEVNLTAVDQSPGSGVKEIHYKLDSGTEQISPGSTVSITVSADGIHSLSYWAVDNYGNAETQHAVEIKIDTVSPVVTIAAPVDGAYYKTANVPSGAFTVVEANSYTTVESGWASNPDGSKTYIVTATDAAGNVGSASVTYAVDNTAPVVTIIAPTDGAYYKTSDVPAGAYTVVELNPYTSVESGYSTSEGVHTYAVTATDSAGNVGSASVTYTVDNTAPVVTIAAPLDGHYYKTVDVPSGAFTVVEANPCTTVESGWANSPEGSYTYTVTVTDAAGNDGSASVTYTVDNIAPVVTITAPMDGVHYVSSTVPAAKFSVTDINPTSVVENGYSTAEGTHTYTVTATDAAGNVGFASVTYTVDYLITVTQGAHGTISPGTTSVTPGGSQSFTITPSTGYHIVNVLVDGVSEGAVNSWDFIDVQSDHSITAAFTIDQFLVTVNVGAHGSSNLATQTIDWNTQLSFIFTPDEGYHVADVVVNGTTHLGSVVSYNPTITGATTVDVTFTIDQFTITVTQTAGGLIVPETSLVDYGATPSFIVTPDVGYHIVSITANGVPVTVTSPKGQTYQFSAVSADGSLTATYVIDQFTIIVTQATGGSIAPDTTIVNYGGSQSFTITPDIGYHIVDVLVDDASKGPVTSWDFTDVKADHTITAIFTQNEYTLTVTTVGSGTVAKVPDQATYHYGDVVQLTANAALGWNFSSWSGALSGSTNPTVITMNGNKSVTATFTQVPYTLTVTFAPIGGGSVSLNNTDPYHYGDHVQLTAVPTINWTFTSWSGDLLGSVNPAVITIDGNKIIAAHFTLFDIAVTEVVPSSKLVYLGNKLNVTVTVKNTGLNTESFDVTLFCNTTSIETQAVSNLGPDSMATLSFVWNTTGFAYGNFTISASAVPVAGELNTVDNTLIGGTAFVTVPGDINSDGKVDSADLFLLSKAYGSTQDAPNWNSTCDINQDNIVDAADLFILSENYQKTVESTLTTEYQVNSVKTILLPIAALPVLALSFGRKKSLKKRGRTRKKLLQKRENET